MLDIKVLRTDLDRVVKSLARRGQAFEREPFERLESERKRLQIEVEAQRQARNERSKAIGRAKAAGDDIAPLTREVGELGRLLAAGEQRLGEVERQLEELLAGIPNLLHETVPDGADSSANVEVRRWGVPAKLPFAARDHVDVGEKLGLLDLEGAAKVAGSRFVVLRGALARLHRALIQFMLDLHTSEHGYVETYVPYLVNERALFGTSQLPKFRRELFAVEGDAGFFLIPTAEVPLTNLVRESIIEAERLPIKLAAHTPCFRSEAGAYGKDTRGMFRQHQFRESRARTRGAAGGILRCARGARGARGDGAAPPRVAVPGRDAMRRRHGLRRREDVRHRGLVTRAGHVSRNFLVQQFRGLSGQTHAGAVAQSRDGQARDGAHAQRLRRRRRPRLDRSARELSAGGRVRSRSRGPCTVYGRHGRDRAARLSSSAARARHSGAAPTRNAAS
jgi:hypothetical protein